MKCSRYNIITEFQDKILVYNSYTKSSILLAPGSNTEVFNNMDEFKRLDIDFQNVLIENGFIINDDKDELSELKYIFMKKYFNSDFMNIVLIPSLSCNFKCPYCCEKGNQIKENTKEYFKTLKIYAEKHFKNNKCIQISLFGGEPLLYIDECISFLNWVNIDSKKRDYNYITTIVTNGSLITEDTVKKLLEHNLRSLQITIDSDKETHDKLRTFKDGSPSFDILVDKIELILKLTEKHDNFKFTLRINLSNTTVEKVSNSISKIKNKYRNKIDLLIRVVYSTYNYNKKNSNKISELEKYFDMGKKLGFNIKQDTFNYQSCEGCADSKFFYLLPDLSMWKCINDLSNKNACIGKINDDGEPESIPDKIINWYNYSSSVFSDEECLNCKLLPDCLGGCIMYKCKNEKKMCRPFDMTSKIFIY